MSDPSSTPPNSQRHFERNFGRVGWFIPPYIQMGALSKACAAIERSGEAFTQDDLEQLLATFYEPFGLAAMILHRYPATPAIQDYKETIEEAVEAHFMGLHHVAVAGLMPVIEGAGRRLASQRGIAATHVKDVFRDLAAACKADGIGNVGEIASMMDSFSAFAENAFFANSETYDFGEGTNRHGVAHGAYGDVDYGRPLNFFKVIAAVDFLTFVASFRANISWFAPDHTEQSIRLAAYFSALKNVRKDKARIAVFPGNFLS